MTETPLFWLKKVEHLLEGMKEPPALGFSPPFPWKECEEELASLLQMPELEIKPCKTQLLAPEHVLSGLGKSPVDTSIALTPLGEAVHFVMAQEDIATLTHTVLSPQTGVKGMFSSKFQEGFYRYLTLNILQALDSLKPFQDLSLKLAPKAPLPLESSLCIDVTIKHPQFAVWGRVICPASFLQAFKTHFNTYRPSLLSLPLVKTLDVDLHLTIGSAVLTPEEWEKVHVGDCIVLDRCTYDPKTHKGTATLMLENSPLFRARLKENSLKIVDYAFYYEEDHSMKKEPEDSEEGESVNEDLDNSLPEEENENHLWSTKNGAEKTGENLVNPHEIPLNVTVEVARIKMNLEKLLQLQAGSLIELPVRPEQGVDLVVNGSSIAKGELVKIGEVLGVKILHIGE